MSSPKKILIANAWGGNRGDEAMINTLSRLIHSVDSEALVYAMPYRDENLELDSDIRVIRDRVGIYYYASFSSMFRFMSRFRHGLSIMKPFYFMMRFFGHMDLMFLRGFDYVLSSPQGPTISDIYDCKKKTLNILKIAKDLGVSFSILGVSMGPFKKMRDENWVHSVLRRADKIIVREAKSLANVKQKYPDLNNIEDAIDMVFARPADIISKPTVLRNKHQQFVETLDGTEIGACISLTSSTDPLEPFFEEKNLTEYLKKMTDFFDYVIENTGGKLILFSHVIFDLEYLEKIKELAKFKDRMIIYPTGLDSDFQQDCIGKLAFYISTRYHPTIFAVKAGTPFFCIKNEFKVEGMMSKLNLDSNNCWQHDTLETYKSEFMKSWSSRNEMKKALISARSEAYRIAGRYREVLNELLLEPKAA